MSHHQAMVELDFQTLREDTWSDFEALFGPRGAYGGCWCMWWRTTRKDFEVNQGAGNQLAMKSIVKSGRIPGILGYHQGRPIGWCSVAPREYFNSLERSPVLKRLDDQPVWSIVCIFVAKGYRGKGIAAGLIHGALDYVREKGGQIVEAYPTAPRGKRLPPVSSFMGTPELFKNAGFVECARPSRAKVVMRYTFPPKQ